MGNLIQMAREALHELRRIRELLEELNNRGARL